MVQKIAYGEVSDAVNKMQLPNKNAQSILIVLLVIVFVTGVYPQLLFNISSDTLQQLFVK
jgi:NADH:ubiquinone oxidoreductase subunit 4 (subunit M)